MKPATATEPITGAAVSDLLRVRLAVPGQLVAASENFGFEHPLILRGRFGRGKQLLTSQAFCPDHHDFSMGVDVALDHADGLQILLVEPDPGNHREPAGRLPQLSL